MKLADYSLKNRAVLWVIIFLITGGGYLAYQDLGRLEDPEFTIKEAVIMTRYPGATAQEVETEVTELIETAVQQLKQLHEVRSISRPGLSIVRAEMEDQYNKDSLPQVWDEMRRKVSEAARNLPPGVSEPYVNDDFGDVYGIFFALTGDGYSSHDLKEIAEDIRMELMLCEDVGRVSFYGIQQEVIYLEMDRSRLSSLGISPQVIFGAISQQNTVVSGGTTRVGPEQVRIEVSGAFEDIEAIESLLITGVGTGELIRIKDVAKVKRGYLEPTNNQLFFNGEPAVGIGISTVPGGNVITMGESVNDKLRAIDHRLPVGVMLNTISYQSETVEKSVNGFVLNLVEAVVIVLVVLVIFMGLRAGIVIGLVLILTILSTFIGMKLGGVMLQRISLGALMIALGMLVDNAIVVVEGIIIKTQMGKSKRDAAIETVSETQWPLLGATVIAILAFAAISISKDVTGEFLGSLFRVIAIALGMSWVLAVTVTPFLCSIILKNKKDATDNHDPYGGWFYRAYRKTLEQVVHHRWITIGGVVALLMLSFFGFGFVKQNFFPESSRPQFMVSVHYPSGTHIDETRERILGIAESIAAFEHVGNITTFVGQGGMRFILTYAPEMPASNYAQLLVSADDYRDIPDLIEYTRKYLNEKHPDALFLVEKFKLGPGGTPIEARIVGTDEDTLLSIADQIMAVMRANDNTEAVRSNWGNKTKTVNIRMSESRSRDTGVTRLDIARSIAMNYSGITGGVYRDGNDILPIMVRMPEKERMGIEQMQDVLVWSSSYGRFLPLEQVSDEVEPRWGTEVIHRLNRKRTVTVSCANIKGTTATLFGQLRPEIEALDFPAGVELEWGGEYENKTEANKKLGANIPLALLLMMLISIMLFNTFRHPFIIFIGLPLALIGVTAGLLVSGQPFGFMATLGFLSLSGMLIKNEIVLLEQINIEFESGKDHYEAIIHASVTRVRPVAMAALTTVLGMIPLLWDPFFAAMAVTIMAGLTFATALTLIFVPVLYATFYRVHAE